MTTRNRKNSTEQTGKQPDISPCSPGWVDKAVNIINGVFGDYLRKQQNALEIQMAFYHQNKPILLNKRSLQQIYPHATSKICILVPGSCCTEDIWRFTGEEENNETYGSLLQKDLGYTPLYVRYNSGLHISINGRFFADLMESLISSYPRPVEEITLIGHSMGGLIIRSGCHIGLKGKQKWVRLVRRAFYIASPHLGAPLEKFGNILTTILHVAGRPYTKLAGDFLNLRSSGIKDLRYANLVENDWKWFDPDELLLNRRTLVPLMQDISHYIIVGALMDEEHWLSSFLGDAWVRLPSAKGKTESNHSPPFPEENIKVFPQYHHYRLAYDRDVYEQIKQWCMEKRKNHG